jgi:N-acetylglucosaminylphosphatidylinositol deacetylase
MLCIFIAAAIPLFWWVSYRFFQWGLPVSPQERCLLVIAHPDDETMFFGPTIRQLLKADVNIFVLSISCGNADGLGKIRKQELNAAVNKLGVTSDNLTVLDLQDYPDGSGKWEVEKLSKIILQYIEKLDCNLALTFDSRGISGHPNHISCFRALQYLYTNGMLPSDVQVFVLETVTLFRKYSSFLDLFLSSLRSTFLNIASPKDVLAIWSAMGCHKSQLLWFRYLYIIFSRYIIINSLKRIPLHRYYTKTKKF